MPSPIFQAIRNVAHATNAHILSPLDRFFRAQNPQQLPPPLFVIGVPRSGTTLTYQLLTYQFQTGYLIDSHNLFFGCPNLVTRLAKPFIKRPRPTFISTYGRTNYRFAPAESGVFWLRWFPVDDERGHYVLPDTPNNEHTQTIQPTLQSLAHILNRPMVFKSVYLTVAVGALAQLLPDALFILVERDLLYNCQSLLLARQKKGGGEWWSVRPPSYQQWLQLPLWQQVARQVYFTQQIARRDLSQYANGRYYTLSYEALCQNPHEQLAQFANWLVPYGYQTYPDGQVPLNFTVSTQWKLDESLRHQIQTELARLEETV